MSKIRHLNPSFDNLTESLKEFLSEPYLTSLIIVASTSDVERSRLIAHFGPLEDIRNALNEIEWEIKKKIIYSEAGIEVELED